MESKAVGMTGLGIMGSAMSGNLHAAGFVLGCIAAAAPRGTPKGRRGRRAQLPGSGQEVRHRCDFAALR